MLNSNYILVGGFLGAGKTTAILKAAEQLSQRGLRVGLITNDQSQGLVDTAMLASHGFPTEEITGGCFCCRFPSLIEASQRLEVESRPDVFLAEPVGSCTDLFATVVLPLRKMYGNQFGVSPLSVLVDPIRVQRVLGLKSGKSFSPKVTYIYEKQLEEADILVVNKRELLEPEELNALVKALESKFPRAKVLSMSARTGEGLEAWLDTIQAHAATPNATGRSGPMDVDYDTYADGEAQLGWLNMTVHVGGTEFDGNAFLISLLADLQKRAFESVDDGIRIAHLKATLTPSQGNDVGVANLVRDDFSVEQSHRLQEPLSEGTLLLNFRAEASPEVMQNLADSSLRALLAQLRLTGQEVLVEAFRPSRPNPTHRLAEI
ncbi:MAG: cobalamin biosynthesis protein P47K [Planctomycetes bacterium]|nr:cobalamin biosynthesis protein P47K [Planctomycetota bacterium]